MLDFSNKLTRMNDLFICKFSVSDYVNNIFKIYFISPDGDHQYLSINQIQNEQNNYNCVIGELHLNGKKNTVFEDTEIESFVISRDCYREFVVYHNQIPMWERDNIIEIEKNYGDNLVV